MAENDTEPVSPELRTVRPQPVSEDDYFSAYANGVGIAHTFFDFQFHFSEMRIAALDNIKAEVFATIMMSPQHAKVFLHHLQNNLSLYEAKFGEIKIPEGLLELAQTQDVPVRAEHENIYQEPPEKSRS